MVKGIVEAKAYKTKSLLIDGKWFDCEGIWGFAKTVNKEDEVDYTLDTENDKKIKYIKVLKAATTPTQGPSERNVVDQKFAEKNADFILRENVLRTAVMYLEAQKENLKIVNLEGLFGMAQLMEDKIRNGFVDAAK